MKKGRKEERKNEKKKKRGGGKEKRKKGRKEKRKKKKRGGKEKKGKKRKSGCVLFFFLHLQKFSKTSRARAVLVKQSETRPSSPSNALARGRANTSLHCFERRIRGTKICFTNVSKSSGVDAGYLAIGVHMRWATAHSRCSVRPAGASGANGCFKVFHLRRSSAGRPSVSLAKKFQKVPIEKCSEKQFHHHTMVLAGAFCVSACFTFTTKNDNHANDNNNNKQTTSIAYIRG